MLICPIYTGQGLGNQLHCYITTRCLAIDKGYEFRVAFPERFKGYFFKDLYMKEVKGIEVPIEGQSPTKLPEGISYYRESMANNGDYDDFIFNIPDNYMIHGNLQGERYFEKHKDKIRKWLDIEPLSMPNDLCIINFRGGEYVGVSEFFLPQSYWDNAILNMQKINPSMRFEVHTDDVNTAQKFFPDFKCIHDVALNWRSIRYAKYLIISNSSFAWLPSWLNEDVKLTIAPKYWARYNTGYWFLRQNKSKDFGYQDKNGNLEGSTYDSKWIINNYNDFDLEWIKEYTDDFVVCDKKDKNVGYNIYDYMDFIIKNYDYLPDMMFFIKGNMLSRHISKEEFDLICNNRTFTPILTQNHGTYMPTCYYKDGLYYEKNDSWYFNHHEHKHFHSYNEFADLMRLPKPEYLGFAPGGCYMVPKENILKRSKDFYIKLRSFVDYCQEPAEAHAIERALYTIWK